MIKSKNNLGLNEKIRFVWPANPWFIRGENFNHGTGAGVFEFGNANGSTNTNVSFRVITMLEKNSKCLKKNIENLT